MTSETNTFSTINNYSLFDTIDTKQHPLETIDEFLFKSGHTEVKGGTIGGEILNFGEFNFSMEQLNAFNDLDFYMFKNEENFVNIVKELNVSENQYGSVDGELSCMRGIVDSVSIVSTCHVDEQNYDFEYKPQLQLFARILVMSQMV